MIPFASSHLRAFTARTLESFVVLSTHRRKMSPPEVTFSTVVRLTWCGRKTDLATEATMRSLTLERMNAERPEESLVNAARAGDRVAFAALFARDRDLVFAFAFARLLNREDAEDVLQETFVRAFQSL